ncbi:hypothetical protein HOO68_00365 [Candidatus Gracilibacteria bacterium]|nr:hypothetical protein [Candidatus Gracilibacteria bacterium]
MSQKISLKRSNDILDDVTFEKDDLFNRIGFGKSLLNLIEHSENESLVISINAPWGEGKTHFLKMWKNYLINEKTKKVIYFNSFKNDYLEDPFTALLGELVKEFEADKTTTRKILDKGINVLKGILPLGGKIGARFILGGDIQGVENKLEELVEGDIVEGIKNALSEYTKHEDIVKAFRETLEDIIKDKGDIIFIIDELDRCRPDFALRLLERIKHFFEIKGLYFVLGINKEQIEKYISRIYGNIDATKYLQKFIDIETILPSNSDRTRKDIEKYISFLFNKSEWIFSEKLEAERNHIIQVFKRISLSSNRSLRDIEKAFNYLILIRKSTGHQEYLSGTLCAILVFLKVIDIKNLIDLKNGKLKKESIVKELDIEQIEDRYKELILDELSIILDIEIGDELIAKLSAKGMDDSYEDRKNLLYYHINLLESFNIA